MAKKCGLFVELAGGSICTEDFLEVCKVSVENLTTESAARVARIVVAALNEEFGEAPRAKPVVHTI